MEAQLQSLPVLYRLNILEKQLDELEKRRDTEKVIIQIRDICKTSSEKSPILHVQIVRFIHPFYLLFQNKQELANISKESWENLMTRVLLLETKLELRKAQVRQMYTHGILPSLLLPEMDTEL